MGKARIQKSGLPVGSSKPSKHEFGSRLVVKKRTSYVYGYVTPEVCDFQE